MCRVYEATVPGLGLPWDIIDPPFGQRARSWSTKNEHGAGILGRSKEPRIKQRKTKQTFGAPNLSHSIFRPCPRSLRFKYNGTEPKHQNIGPHHFTKILLWVHLGSPLMGLIIRNPARPNDGGKCTGTETQRSALFSKVGALGSAGLPAILAPTFENGAVRCVSVPPATPNN